MGGSRIFDWEGPPTEKAQDDGQKVALYPLKSWPIGGGAMALWPPLEPPLINIKLDISYTFVKIEHIFRDSNH